MRKVSAQSGQALVLILLSLSVVLTLVLFVLSRSVTDIAVSSREEEAVRAFSAAEAGIEKSLVVGVSSPLTEIGDASYTADVTSFAQGASGFAYPINLSSGEAATLWFADHDADSNIVCGGSRCFTGSQLKICWGKPGTLATSAVTPAVELSVFYTLTPGDYSTLRIARAAFDPYGDRRTMGVGGSSPNNFSDRDLGTCTIGGDGFEFQKTIDLATLGILPGSYSAEGGLQLARLRLFYNTDSAHKVGFDVGFPGNSTLPSQGLAVDSSGEAGESTRRLSVFQGWPEAPSVFGYSVYSSIGLTK